MFSPAPAGRERATRLFWAPGTRTRLDILTRLVGGEEWVEAGLARDRREGRRVYYSIIGGALDEQERLPGLLKDDRRLTRVAQRCGD